MSQVYEQVSYTWQSINVPSKALLQINLWTLNCIIYSKPLTVPCFIFPQPCSTRLTTDELKLKQTEAKRKGVGRKVKRKKKKEHQIEKQKQNKQIELGGSHISTFNIFFTLKKYLTS